ncbi:MAG: pyridoxamine 5'-phosphate oxidase [Deltaproteobacteria bacterium]|nr:pyridoxamine 5'-phosphate oxidase [Deltaproteobacteria bacterium]
MKENDPIGRFEREYARAAESEPFEGGRCALATADAQGRPSVRFVLLKGFDARGFVFYTNFDSRKARDLEDNPHAALVFHWHTTGVQVRVRGSVTRVSDEEADAYFASRDLGSRLSAWASKQSAELDDPKTLEAKVAKMKKRFEDVPAVRPPFWGGFRITPDAIEFWENRDDRLHDRWLYRRGGDGWSCVRLYP